MTTPIESALDALPDGVIVFAADWRILLINRTAAQLLGLPRDELIGKALGRDLLYLDGARMALYREAMQTRQWRRLPGVRLSRPGEEDRLFDGEVHPVAGDGIAVLFRDVTALVQLLGTTRADADAARAAAASERDALTTLSHEIRSPLHALLGYADLLGLEERGAPSERQRGYLDQIAATGQHLLSLVNEILDSASAAAARGRDTAAPGNAGEDVGAALVLVRPQALARHISLEGQCAAEPPLRYRGRPIRVRQIVVNMLANAVRFSRGGGRVVARCEPALDAPVIGAGPWVHIAVEDDGSGILPDDLQRIFEPFVQLEPRPPAADASRGSGLGLAISRRMAREMGGEITVTSAIGAGSTFSLWLPMALEGRGGGRG